MCMLMLAEPLSLTHDCCHFASGRDEEAEGLMQDMLPPFKEPKGSADKAVCVSGSTGIGRLTFCLDLGQRIRRAGASPGML